MPQLHAPTVIDRSISRGPSVLWLLASLILLQWSVPGGEILSFKRSASSQAERESSGRSAQPPVKLRDLAKLIGAEVRKDGKQHAASAGGDAALGAWLRQLRTGLARSGAAFGSLEITPGRIDGLAFEARAPPGSTA